MIVNDKLIGEIAFGLYVVFYIWSVYQLVFVCQC